MFGHSDNSQGQNDQLAAAHDEIAASAQAFASDDGASLPGNGGGAPLGTFMNDPANGPVASPPTIVAPANPAGAGLGSAPEPPSTVEPAVPHDEIAPQVTPLDVAPNANAPVTDDLLDIKHEALEALTPLVGQLNQTPEEQFRTTMMMIQASDNHSLIKVAYEAAQQIADEKERAQALLDIVNEINYFTQQA